MARRGQAALAESRPFRHRAHWLCRGSAGIVASDEGDSSLRTVATWLKPGPGRARIVYWTVWLALALPLPFLLWTGLHGSMRQRDELVRQEGLMAVRILIAGFALSPLARLLRWPALRRYKRTAGLFGFAYAACHGVYYFLYGRVWQFPLRIWERRLYIPLGILCLVLLIPLAVTSTDGLMRQMGPRAWRRLHAAIYPVMLMAAIHALWQSNIDYTQPQIYLGIIAFLLLVRLPPVMNELLRLTGRGKKAAAPA